MDVIARECRYVTGRTVPNGGAGDSSVLTAFGVFQGMRAAAEHAWGSASLEGRRAGIEGAGKVGYRLAAHLAEAGARLVVCDVDPAAVRRVLAAHPDADELHGFSFERAKARAAEIYTTTKRIFALADEEGVPPAAAADRLAERRMSEVGRLRGIWLGA
jgi:glutamate dehydrogenase/leucine dehydrogenase